MFQDILVPVDLSDGSHQALRLAIKLAKATSGRLILLHVGIIPTPIGVEPHPMISTDLLASMRDQLVAEQKHAMEKLAREELPVGMDYRIALREGYPPDEILAEAKESKAEVIVMGTHGRTGLTRVLLGSVAERVLRESPVPVLVTK